MTIPPLYDHQEDTAKFMVHNPAALCTSDPVTGEISVRVRI